MREYLALEEFLKLCMEHRDDTFFPELTTVSLRTVNSYDPSPCVSPKFDFEVKQTKPGVVDAVQQLQKCLQEDPNTGIQEDIICDDELCTYAQPTRSAFALNEMFADEEMEWIRTSCA